MNSEILGVLAEQFAAQSPYELIAFILAIAYVWLAAKQNLWCWPCALCSTAIYSWLFWSVTLPFNALLNVYYMLMAIYAWYNWHSVKQDSTSSSWPIKRHVLAIFCLCLVSWGLSELAAQVLNSQFLYLDAFVTVFSIFTTVLIAQKVIDNWLYWIVINPCAAYLYYENGLYLTACLFIAYFGFSVFGYLQWRRLNQELVSN